MQFKQIKLQYRLYSLLGVIFVSAGLVLFQFSCYPGEPISASDTDVVVTFYDPAADFSGKIYAMPDSVIHVSDPDLGSGSVSHVYDQQILNRIKQNLERLGYTEVLNPAEADVLVLAAAASSTYVGSDCYWYYDWWYGYPGYCYPVAYSFTTGSVLISMVNAGNTVRTNAMWVAGINGLVSESSSASISARINTDIDQAFEQSPYLK